jgi:hypothetical protein
MVVPIVTSIILHSKVFCAAPDDHLQDIRPRIPTAKKFRRCQHRTRLLEALAWAWIDYETQVQLLTNPELKQKNSDTTDKADKHVKIIVLGVIPKKYTRRAMLYKTLFKQMRTAFHTHGPDKYPKEAIYWAMVAILTHLETKNMDGNEITRDAIQKTLSRTI